MQCTYHLCNNILTGKQTKYCSLSCKNKAGVRKFRRNLKRRAVVYKGGKCLRCGYNRYVEALEFHHRDPDEKDFTISKYMRSCGKSTSWDTIALELDKCDMLCSNCHKGMHAVA